MATPVFCCGFECGVLKAYAVGTDNAHWATIAGTPTFETTTIRSGSRALRCAATASTCIARNQTSSSYNDFVGRIYLRFVTLPSASTRLINGDQTTGPSVYFNQTDSKIYARVDTTNGATGVSVTTGVFYRVDVTMKYQSGGVNDTCSVQVNGTACGTASAAGQNVSNVMAYVNVGVLDSCTADVIFDDYVTSDTAADYPLGAGYVHHFVPTSDGTHNIAGTGDFARTLTGTDILNATTTAYQLVDDVPLESTPTDWINMVAPANATDYVECIFGPAPAIAVPTNAPRAVEVIAAIHQAAATTGNMEVRLNDNGSLLSIHSATAVAGSTTLLYKRWPISDPPSAATAWVIGGGGNGDFTDLRVRFGSPAAVDANPDQYLDCIMIEAEFSGTAPLPPVPFQLPRKDRKYFWNHLKRR